MHAVLGWVLASLSGCVTQALWFSDRPAEQVVSKGIDADSMDAPGMQRLAARLQPAAAEDLLSVLSSLDENTTTLWIESRDEPQLGRCLRRGMAAGGGLTATCELRVTRGLLGEDWECSLELRGAAAQHSWMESEPGAMRPFPGEVAMRMPCRVSAGPAPPVREPTPVDRLWITARATPDQGLPVALRVILTPAAVVLDAALLPIEVACLLYMTANMY